MIRKSTFVIVAGIMVAAAPSPAAAEDPASFEECIIQCRQWYGGDYYQYQRCYTWCVGIFGPPPAVPMEQLGKLD